MRPAHRVQLSRHGGQGLGAVDAVVLPLGADEADSGKERQDAAHRGPGSGVKRQLSRRSRRPRAVRHGRAAGEAPNEASLLLLKPEGCSI